MHHPDLRRVMAVIAQSTAAPVREAVAGLWAARPDLLDDAGAARALGTDPSVAVRRRGRGSVGRGAALRAG